MNLNQVTIPSTNIARAINFYEKLGLILIVKALTHYARFESPEGDSTFSIHLVDKLPEGQGIYIYFEVPELDKKVQNLIDAGIVFEEMPKDQRWLWREARLKDPDKNQIILYFAGDHRKNPPWKIKK